jgi:phospho-N-acetylmuramoyl-pentapeptide-transferase
LLYWLLYEKLFHYFPPFRIFRYLTFRTAFASLTALFTGLIVGPLVINRLREFQIGQYIREEGPKAHQKKAGTPTMGGLLIAISIVIPTLLWADLTNRFVWIAIVATSAFAAIGFSDDYIKVVNRRNLGLTGKAKIGFQIATSVLIAVALIVMQTRGLYSTKLLVPFFKQFRPDLVIGSLERYPHLWPLAFLPFIAFVVLVIVGASNAVNLTDGLDGLAIMPTVMIGSALGVFSYVVGRADYARYLLFPHIPGAGELVVVCGAISGAGLAFLWFNAYPAEVFMGDVGALALGAALGTIAVITRQEIVLFIMGGVFVAETVSVAMQVLYFRWSGGRRIFRMAPLHHHFELSGWKETQVVVRFWIISMMLVLVGLSTLKLR